MDQNSWNVAGMQLEVLERSWNIQEWTKNFHSNCIPVHSSSSVIGVLHRTTEAKSPEINYSINARSLVIYWIFIIIWLLIIQKLTSN